MRMITKIACRTLGAAGMAAALYDACRVAGHESRAQSQLQQSKHIEDIYFKTRDLDNMSYLNQDIHDTVFDERLKNPLPYMWGGAKGATVGFLSSLGHNLFTITSAAFAILSKGVMAKIGAAGVVLGACYKIARHGFGLGKQNPMS